MNIPASMVKELRERTGAGMMDCKAALRETEGDMDGAVDWLRTKGLAAAAKKAGRAAAEGLVGVAGDAHAAAMIELNSETDFVARNASFQALVSKIAGVALQGYGDIEALNAAMVEGEQTVAAQVAQMIGTIGENMTLRRVARLAVEQGAVAHYTHSQIAPGLGKIGVLVAIESAADPAALFEFGRKIAMHIAATNPLALQPEDVPAEAVSRERAIFETQAAGSGKPANIVEKMVEGRLRKFFAESTLLQQAFVMEPDVSVGKFTENTARQLGAPITIAGFRRFALGEGVAREEKDFAAEVNSIAGA